MIKKIWILYIEGYDDRDPKQEKHLFQSVQSKRIWDSYFKEMRFDEGGFQLIPKIFTSKKNKKTRYKIVDKKISNLLAQNTNDEKIILHLIITGDHDEVKDMKAIQNREKIANEIQNLYKNKENIKTKIILERDKNFKIEDIMSEMIKSKVNKKILKDKLDGNKYPNIIELKGVRDSKINDEEIIKNMMESNHPLFKRIKNIK